MKNKNRITIVLFAVLLFLSGCGKKSEQTDLKSNEANFIKMSELQMMEENILDESDIVTTPKSEAPKKVISESFNSEKLLDAYLISEIPAIYGDGIEILFDQLLQENEEVAYLNFSVGERIDLDNDGEDEQIINGPYGGLYLDARDQKVYVFARGEGTSGMLSYINYDNAVWIVHSDTSHMGRQMFWLTRYDGGEKIVEELLLAAEYWDSPNGVYDENSDFTFREEKISMKTYEALRKELFGW